ncbi:MAG: ExeM/NucH family extracellular endonuclease [Anaerolineae bacterium]|nr:ExeM/NucH family extracellular endonuclease [Anaerolineae bacterium]
MVRDKHRVCAFIVAILLFLMGFAPIGDSKTVASTGEATGQGTCAVYAEDRTDGIFVAPGGQGGWGGDPTKPNAGNPYGGVSEQDDGSNGGRGGDGGSGGGAGGPTVGILVAGGSSPILSGNSFTVGAAGPGGASPGNPGADGFQAEVETISDPAFTIINEVDADTAGADTLEFIELYDGGGGYTDLTGLVVVVFNGNGDVSYAALDLDGFSTDANGYFVIGNAGVANVDLVFSDGSLQNGADAVAVYASDRTDFPSGTPITTTNLLDALVYDTNDDDDPGLLALLNAGEPQVNEGGSGDKDNHSNQRCPNGSGGQRNTDSYTQSSPTPGADNDCGGDIGACGEVATLIHDIQGSGLSSPMSGSTDVVIEGVVVGDFQDAGLQGFFVQEEDADADADAATSEGIFVYSTSVVTVGDKVRVQGDVTEHNDLTETNNVDQIEVCSSGMVVTAAPVTLPFSSTAFLERYEGMLVTFPQKLTVSENCDLGRYGQVLLSYGRLMNPTNVVTPGVNAGALQAANDLNRLILDDGDTVLTPDPIIYPTPELSATNTLRGGYTTQGLIGVLDYRSSEYRVQPTASPAWDSANPRTSEPGSVGGTVRVASFDVLNYLNGDGLGGGFPTSGGADSLSEFNRQRDKIIGAILAMDADVIGLVGIENDGYDANSAIQDLVNGLNASAPVSTTYAFVNPGFSLGTDEIKVAFLYRTETITPTGSAATTTTAPFDAYRPPLAQTFEERATGGRFTLVVNHFKSKGCSGASGGDADQEDGQECYNATRTEMATVLIDWLATDPTGSGDPDLLIIGDLSAYAMEDPITTIEGAGYTDLVEAYVGEDAYSFVLFGQAGYLDHALADEEMSGQVTGATVWHINADEPSALDYNEESKSADQLVSLYGDDPYRSSDHDPVIVGLALGRNKVYLPVVLRGHTQP